MFVDLHDDDGRIIGFIGLKECYYFHISGFGRSNLNFSTQKEAVEAVSQAYNVKDTKIYLK